MAGIEVRLVTPEREVWAGRAQKVIARTVDGELGVLPGMAPLLGLLAIGALHLDTESAGMVDVAVQGGFLHVNSRGDETIVEVLAEHAELAAEIDVARAEREQAEASAQVEQRADDETRAELAWAVTRLRVGG